MDDRGVGDVGGDRGAVELVREQVEETAHRRCPLAVRVHLDQRPDGLFADGGIAVAQGRDEGRHRRGLTQLAERLDDLHPHLRLGVVDEGGEMGHGLAAPALAERLRRFLSGLGVGALQVCEKVFQAQPGGGAETRRGEEQQQGGGSSEALVHPTSWHLTEKGRPARIIAN